MYQSETTQTEVLPSMCLPHLGGLGAWVVPPLLLLLLMAGKAWQQQTTTEQEQP